MALADLTMALDGPGCPRLVLGGFNWVWLVLARLGLALILAGFGSHNKFGSHTFGSPFSIRHCIPVCAYI